MLRKEVKELLLELSKIAHKGPIPAIGHGSTSVGMTLLNALGIEYQSTDKPHFKGIVVNGRRDKSGNAQNRVNLFAKVPNWKISGCKSSAEIAELYGYDTSVGRKLYCTVRARKPNSQGLYLQVNKNKGVLQECIMREGKTENVASWYISDLTMLLASKHPETIWVNAKASTYEGKELFHYREAFYTSSPKLDLFAELLEEGTITLDHLIETKSGRTSEKGPLFKIKPSNIPALFSSQFKFDLFSIEDD